MYLLQYFFLLLQQSFFQLTNSNGYEMQQLWMG